MRNNFNTNEREVTPRFKDMVTTVQSHGGDDSQGGSIDQDGTGNGTGNGDGTP